jgi:predicted acylesterase/phospholipase RssA
MPNRPTAVFQFCGRFMHATRDVFLRFARTLVCRCALRIAEGLVQCWYIIAIVLFSAMILAATEQGREAVFAATEFPNLFTEGLATLCALLAHVYLATVFACFILAPNRSGAGTATRYAAYNAPALVGLIAWFVPSILFQHNGNMAAPAIELPAAIRVLIVLPPALAILYARDSTSFRVNRKILRHVFRTFWRQNGEDQRITRALTKVRTITLAFCGLALVAIAASFWIKHLLTAAIIYYGAFLASDCFLYRYYRGPRTAIAFAVVVSVVIGWSISAGIVSVRSLLPLASTILRWLHSDAIPWLELHVSSSLHSLSRIDLELLYAPVFQFFQAPSFLIGSAATFLASIDFWIALGFLVAILSRRFHWRNGRNVVAFAIILLVAWRFFTGPFNVREVRLLDGGDAMPIPELRDHARKWLSERRTDIQAADRYPVFIVNADGGGVRSAYWTAALLSALQDRDSTFAGHVFAISGVSGGSLGAAVFAAMAQEAHESKEAPCAALAPFRQSSGKHMPWQECAFNILHRDFLAPALSAMLVPDLVRNILPLGEPNDRAIALEQGFEAAWYWANDNQAFSNGLQDLWRGDLALHVPSLFLNCTDAVTGKRLVMSNVRLGIDNAERRDLAALLGERRIRLSTAVLLSARFPGISPAGWLPERPEAPDRGALVVDGGYVDNSGTLTASEVVDAIEAAMDAEKPAFDHVILVALMIANDPVPETPPIPATSEPAGISTSIVGSLLVPVQTLDVLRQVQTIKLKRDYTQHVRDLGGIVFHELTLRADSVEFPLGWTLARPTMEAMDAQISAMADKPTSHLSQALSLLSSKPR